MTDSSPLPQDRMTKRKRIRTPEELHEAVFGNHTFGELFRENLSLLRPQDGVEILEIGSGLGFEAVELASRGARVRGIDKRPKAVAQAEALARDIGVEERCVFEVGPVESLPYPDDSFDAVFSKSVLQYVDRARVIEECLRVLRPGGALVMIENLPNNPLVLFARATRRLLHRTDEDRAYLATIRGYLTYREARELSGSLAEGRCESRHLFAAITTFWLRSKKLPKHATLHRLHSFLTTADKCAFRFLPVTRNLAWIGCVSGRKLGQS